MFELSFKLGRSKKQQRQAADVGRGFQVTQADRTRRAIAFVTGLIASADLHLDSLTLGKLREFCRMHDRRTGLFSGMLDRAIDNIFGADFDFIPRTADKEVNKIVKAYITRQMQKENFDAPGLMDFVEGCHTTLRAIWNDGDNLWVKQANGSVMAYEADQIDTPADKKDNITLGVEKTPQGRPVALHIKQRPNAKDSGYASTAGITSARIKIQNTIWPAYRKRFGQTRGLPFIAAALSSYGRLNNYLEFESLAAEGAAMQGMKITKQPDEGTLPGVTQNKDTKTSSTFDQVQKWEPFMVWDLLPGEDVDTVSAERPSDSFTPYIMMMCRIIGVAVGYPIELMLLDFSKGNFSGQRAAMQEARRSFRRWQGFCQKKICQPWYTWQIVRGIASGKLPARPDIYNVSYQWPGWAYVEPYKEANANKVCILTNQKSVSECIRSRGLEPQEVFDEIEAERKLFKEKGIEPTNVIKAADSPNGNPQPPREDNPNQNKKGEAA
ncbi:MAG: phage portal protein [Planctomycetota bacterium]